MRRQGYKYPNLGDREAGILVFCFFVAIIVLVLLIAGVRYMAYGQVFTNPPSASDFE